MNDEFYIGWQEKAPLRIARCVQFTIVFLLALAAGTALLLARSQRTINTAVFEWGDIKTFSGLLKIQPYPHLLVARPGNLDGHLAFSTYYLVAPFKFGLKPETLAPLDGKFIRLKGTLIYRGNQTMIEARPESLQLSPNTNAISAAATPGPPEDLGPQTLTGEIVDSKCYFGVMNPGNLATHRGCAIRCISGGIPPVLLVRPTNGPPLYFLLVSSDGQPVNRQVLDWVAEPVQITGEVTRQDNLLILHADPASYRLSKN